MPGRAADNMLGGRASASIGDLGPELNELTLDSDGITGAVPDEIGLLTGLTSLSFSVNQITSIPTTIGDLVNLDLLDLSGNQITSIPTIIGDLANLEYLYLSDNSITTVPSVIGQLNLLIKFEIDNNQLTSLPETFRTFSPSSLCKMDGNSGFSCANIGSSSSCCTTQNCGDTSTCYTPP